MPMRRDKKSSGKRKRRSQRGIRAISPDRTTLWRRKDGSEPWFPVGNKKPLDVLNKPILGGKVSLIAGEPWHDGIPILPETRKY